MIFFWNKICLKWRIISVHPVWLMLSCFPKEFTKSSHSPCAWSWWRQKTSSCHCSKSCFCKVLTWGGAKQILSTIPNIFICRKCWSPFFNFWFFFFNYSALANVKSHLKTPENIKKGQEVETLNSKVTFYFFVINSNFHLLSVWSHFSRHKQDVLFWPVQWGVVSKLFSGGVEM